jgi:4-nitrophenyl phosphatase
VTPPHSSAVSYKHAPIDALEPDVRGLIVDMDGVLWKEATPIGDLPHIFSTLAARGIRMTAATNNATRSADDYAKRLLAFGVTVDTHQIITSAEATALTLLDRFPQGGRVYVVGEQGLEQSLCAAGFEVVTDTSDTRTVIAVAACMDRAFTYEKLRAAATHIRKGGAFYGTNPDPTFPTPGGLVPGSGSIIAAIAAAAEQQPTVIGKPSPLLFELAARRMSMEKDALLVVGDRLETDIAGGQAWGARTALVLSGVSQAEQAAKWRPRPDLVVSDLAELVGA